MFCPNIGLLSTCVLSLIPLLRPFSWHSFLMPVLPDKLLGFLEAPVPFIIGVQVSHSLIISWPPPQGCVHPAGLAGLSPPCSCTCATFMLPTSSSYTHGAMHIVRHMILHTWHCTHCSVHASTHNTTHMVLHIVLHMVPHVILHTWYYTHDVALLLDTSLHMLILIMLNMVLALAAHVTQWRSLCTLWLMHTRVLLANLDWHNTTCHATCIYKVPMLIIIQQASKTVPCSCLCVCVRACASVGVCVSMCMRVCVSPVAL